MAGIEALILKMANMFFLISAKVPTFRAFPSTSRSISSWFGFGDCRLVIWGCCALKVFSMKHGIKGEKKANKMIADE